MLFQTTSAHEELRAKIRNFAEEEIKPLAFLMDQNNEFPEEAVKKLGKLGWMGIPYPKEYGGAGLDALSYAIAVEELARVDGGAGVILSAHVSLGSWPIFAYGTEEQKKKYLVPLAKGEKIGAFGLTETNAGSDAGGTETTALDKGDYYLLNGGKIFITNAPKADTYVVFAVTTPDIGTRGISAFIVEKGWKGFEFGDHYDKMGIRSSSTAELIFNDVKVPKENLLGKEGEGFKMGTRPPECFGGVQRQDILAEDVTCPVEPVLAGNDPVEFMQHAGNLRSLSGKCEKNSVHDISRLAGWTDRQGSVVSIGP